MNLQIVSDYIIVTKNAFGQHPPAINVPSAEIAAFAIHALEIMLPIVQKNAESSAVVGTAIYKAASEASLMIFAYADISRGNYETGRANVRNIANSVNDAFLSSCPILEEAYELWTSYRERKGQPVDHFYMWVA